MLSIFVKVLRSIALVFAAGVAASCTSGLAENTTNNLPTAETATRSETERRPVLVELFTSEGCSSCPPADRLLTRLETQQPIAEAEVVSLAFHVDYWDRLGWKDRFSSAEFSRRQNDYSAAKRLSSNYTPQMIVDGGEEFVGSDAARSTQAIAKAANREKGTVTIEQNGAMANIRIAGLLLNGGATVFLAVAESGLATDVRSGENRGSILEHTSVVRELRTIGKVGSESKGADLSVELPENAAWDREQLSYVVFVQENETKRVLAVGRARARK